MKKSKKSIRSYSFQNIRLGILGDGQLARMMALEAHQMGIQPWILTYDLESPAAQVTPFIMKGSWHQLEDIRRFTEICDFLTFESEFVPEKALETLDLLRERRKVPRHSIEGPFGIIATNSGMKEDSKIFYPSEKKSSKQSYVQVFPKPDLLLLLQNRQSQKELLDKYKITTSPWSFIQNQIDLEVAFEKLGKNLVLKKNFGGYDGNGTFVFKNLTRLSLPQIETLSSKNSKTESSINKNIVPSKTSLDDSKSLKKKIAKTTLLSSPAVAATTSSFLNQGNRFASENFICEKWIPFKRELAIMIGRTSEGKFISFPLVETQQKNHRCDWVRGPVAHKNLSLLLKRLQKFLQNEDYVGMMGIELFDTGHELIVNEIAPRVHNSGHHSQNSMTHSQFKAHILCGLGINFKAHLREPYFVMTNLIGESDGPIVIPENLMGSLHLYGKNKNCRGRKMGHLNYSGKSPKTLFKLALNERKRILK